MVVASAVLTGTAVGCGPTGVERVLPDVAVVDGIEEARLDGVPDAYSIEHQWMFGAERVVPTDGPEFDEPLIFDPRTALALRDGNLLVHDPSADRPLVLVDPASGRAVVRFARAGQGPGEVGPRLTLGEGGDGALLAVDFVNRQIHRWDRTGGWMGSQRLEFPGGVATSAWMPDADAFLVEHVTMGADWVRHELRVVEPGDREQGLYGSLPEGLASTLPGGPQRGRLIWQRLGDRVVATRSDQPVFEVLEDGALTRRISLPWSRYSVTEADADALAALYGPEYPRFRTGPTGLFNDLVAVSDSVFAVFQATVWRAAEDVAYAPGEAWWRLFTTRGEYLGAVPLPDDFRVLGRGLDGTIWVRLLDENGVPELRELRLMRAGG